ncbi:transmembrane amino acid transporter protein-domain-containing protein [Tuber indicum]|nr:transmembrane amino acid transporter protein-domain-containing protein [Tuber indicum]
MSYSAKNDEANLSSGSPTPTPGAYFPVHHDISPTSSSPNVDIPPTGLRQRRSSLSLGLDAIRYAGGVNSLDNFARSWTRAAGYFEITPSRQSFVSVDPSRDEEEPASSSAIDDESYYDDAEVTRHLAARASLPTTGFGSYGRTPMYGSMNTGFPGARLDHTATRHAADLFVQKQTAGEVVVVDETLDKEREPLLVTTVTTESGKVEQVIVGQSTLPQTVFNSVNVLIGIGLLSLPLGLRYSGWLIGSIFLVCSALITNYTGKLLARCLDKSPNQSLVTYSDIAYIAYGHKSRICVSVLFSLELMAACVALVVLFSDSLNALFPQIDKFQWKIIAGFVLTPLSFLPLKVLSFSSILGILSTFSIVMIIFIDGWLKPSSPGSLREPMPTYLFPPSWWTIPLSFGLLMSPWGGHSVFPNIYKDMRHPKKYNKAVDITYTFTFILDITLAVTGILMFGDGVLDEITSNILELSGYPAALSMAMVAFVAIIPLTKTPLNARPIITTLEIFAGVDPRAIALQGESVGMSGLTCGLLKSVIRIGVNASIVIIAILVPSFDRIMAFLGSALCFSICVILPMMFYLKIYGDEVPKRERRINQILIVVCTIVATTGTVAAFVPKESLGA